MPADEAPSGRDSNPIPPCKHESRAPGASLVLREAAVCTGSPVTAPPVGRRKRTRAGHLPFRAPSSCGSRTTMAAAPALSAAWLEWAELRSISGPAGADVEKCGRLRMSTCSNRERCARRSRQIPRSPSLTSQAAFELQPHFCHSQPSSSEIDRTSSDLSQRGRLLCRAQSLPSICGSGGVSIDSFGICSILRIEPHSALSDNSYVAIMTYIR